MAHFVPDYAVGAVPRRKRLLLAALLTAVILAVLVLIGWVAFKDLSPASAPATSWGPSTQDITLEGDIPVSLSSPELFKPPPDLPEPPAEFHVSTVTYQNTTGGTIWVFGADANVVAFTIEARTPGDDRWSDSTPGRMCGMGTDWHAIAPGESHSFEVYWSPEDMGREARVTLGYFRSSPNALQPTRTWYESHSPPLLLATPATRPTVGRVVKREAATTGTHRSLGEHRDASALREVTGGSD